MCLPELLVLVQHSDGSLCCAWTDHPRKPTNRRIAPGRDVSHTCSTWGAPPTERRRELVSSHDPAPHTRSLPHRPTTQSCSSWPGGCMPTRSPSSRSLPTQARAVQGPLLSPHTPPRPAHHLKHQHSPAPQGPRQAAAAEPHTRVVHTLRWEVRRDRLPMTSPRTWIDHTLLLTLPPALASQT